MLLSSPMAGGIHEAKNALRQQIKIRLSQISIEEKLLQSNYVAGKVIKHQKYLTGHRIGIYLNLPDEIQTDSILKHIFSTGKTCFIPKYNSEKMSMVEMETYEERNTLPKTKWNIPQPSDRCERQEAFQTGGLDVLIVPGRAYTKAGHRLGRGKGYYDKYLAQYKDYCNGKLPYLIGLAFVEQVCDTIPLNDTDCKLNEVIYDYRRSIHVQ